MRAGRWGRGHEERDPSGIYHDAEEFERALRYSRTSQRLVLVGMLWTAVSSCLVLVTGLSAGLRDRAARLAPARLGPVMPYTLALTILSFIMSLPLAYYRGFVVEHRFGLSNQTTGRWLKDELKQLGVSMALILPVSQPAHWVIRRYPHRWWAILSGLTVPFTVLLANLAPVLLLPLFNRFEPLKNRRLASRIRRLAEGQGVHVAEVLQMDMSKQTKKANAFFTGVGNTKRIVLGDTLLEGFSDDEVEVVLAHELAHQVHRDLWKLIGLEGPATFVAFFTVDRLTGKLLRRFGSRWRLNVEQGPADVAALPLMELVGSAVLLVLTPVLNAISRRWIEHPADTYALRVTGKRAAFLGAMQKLGRMNLSDPSPPALVKYLLYDHPTLRERIDFARSYPSKRGRMK